MLASIIIVMGLAVGVPPDEPLSPVPIPIATVFVDQTAMSCRTTRWRAMPRFLVSYAPTSRAAMAPLNGATTTCLWGAGKPGASAPVFVRSVQV